MIYKKYFRTRDDGVRLYRTYSDETPIIKQLPTEIEYDCWIYKTDENGNETSEIDWERSGVIDVEDAPYIYIQVFEED